MTEPIVTTTDLDSYQSGAPQTVIDQATALVRAYCGWHVSPVVTETITVGSDGGRVLMLPSLHVTDITSVTVDGVAQTDYSWSEAGYVTGCYWPTGPRSVAVSLTHGFADAPDVASIILAVASRAQASPDGVVRVQAGQVSRTFSQTAFNVAGGVSLVAHEKAVLDLYRIPGRP